MRHSIILIVSTLLFFAPAIGVANVSRFTVAGLPTCGDAVADGKMVIVTDPTTDEDCTTGAGTSEPHGCVCDWDGAVGTWRLHSHRTIENDLTVNGNLGVGVASPSEEIEIEGANTQYLRVEATAANSVAGVQLANDVQDWFLRVEADDDFVIRDDTAGVNPFTIESGANANSFYVDTTGEVGIGVGVPTARLHVVDNSTSGSIKIENTATNGFPGFDLFNDSAARVFSGVYSNSAASVNTGDAWFATRDSSTKFRLGANSVFPTIDLVIDTTHFVGINIVPTNRFHVNLGSGEKDCLTTASGTACRHGILATAPATCTAPGDTYTDTSGAQCHCWATNTWTVGANDGAHDSCT